nr:MAG TPA: hypothetical protein [Caudoviricetes sp.]
MTLIIHVGKWLDKHTEHCESMVTDYQSFTDIRISPICYLHLLEDSQL